MMPRKKRNTIIIIAILIILLLILGAACAYLYITTDMFKSNITLFTKYVGQNVENLETVYRKIEKNEYNDLLEQNKYTTKTNLKINNIENIGTTLENSENSINQLKLEINGQTDKSNQYNYQNIKLLKNDESITEVEYVQNENAYGIRFSDLFRQYLFVDNESLIELLERNGALSDTQDIPDVTNLVQELGNVFKFTEEEKKQLQDRYLNILNKNISNDNFSVEKNKTIQINQKGVNVNAYTLTLTKEQMNNIYIKLLEELKQDEVILNKIDSLQSIFENYQANVSDSLREDFVEDIEDIIADIEQNNIGKEEAKIIVYENYHKTVRTVIQNPEYEIILDVYSLENENYMQIAYQNKETEEEQLVTYKKQKGEITASYKISKDSIIKEYSLVRNEKVNNNQCIRNVVATYEDNSNRVEATIAQEINIVDNFEEHIEEGDCINLSELEPQQFQSILGQVVQKLTDKVNTLVTSDLNIEDLGKVLTTIIPVQDSQEFEEVGITQTEKSRFNSKFEMLQGEELEGERILTLIEAIEDNFINIEVVSDTEIKLVLDRLNSNQEVIDMMTNFIEENKNKKYNVKAEYDETGLITSMVLTML